MQTAAVQLYTAAGSMVAWVGHTQCTYLHDHRFIYLHYYYLRRPPRTRLHVVQHSIDPI